MNRNNNSSYGWVWMLVIIILIGVIYSAVSNKKKEDEIRSTVKDINYCRSVAAQYGQQGSEEFRNSYYSCLDGRDK